MYLVVSSIYFPMEHSHNLLTFTLLIATLGLLSFAVPQLLWRRRDRSARLPLVIFLVCSGLANGLPALTELLPELAIYGLVLFLPLSLAMPASLWLYTRALTATRPWRLAGRDLVHYIPLGLGAVQALLLLHEPRSTLTSIMLTDQAPPAGWPEFLVLTAFGLLVLWVILAGAYTVAALWQLMRYRLRLKVHFANNDRRELHWLTWIIVAIGCTWLLSLGYSLPLLADREVLLPVAWIAFAHFALLWILSAFGMRQQPGFAGRYLKRTQHTPPDSALNDAKYRKSGLKTAELERIASKIETAMLEQQLYLSPALSLAKLAEQIGVSANYVSQTLNEQLGKTFFDYVNHWRVAHSLPLVLEGHKTVLDIAMDVGFNARSSFYKAFKQETDCTPSQYRARHRPGYDDDERPAP